MKKITNYLKVLVVLLSFSASVKAQCASNFTWTIGTGGAVSFTSTSVLSSTVNPTSYYWSFGNGTTFTATGMPGMATNTTYTANGTYTVSLFILTVPGCSAQVTYTLNITNANGCNLNANFSYSQGPNGVVNFNNSTSGNTVNATFSWNFADSSIPSSINSPAHTYSANGAYQVTLTATNGTCVSSTTVWVNVNTYCNLVASFVATNGSNGAVNFVSTSTGTNANNYYYWQFGDGGAVTTGPTTSHTYINGNYNATLTVLGNSVMPGCADTIVNPITVSNNTCNLTANFSYNVGASGIVSFASTSTGTTSTSTYIWNFGNGYSSNNAAPTNTYQSGGYYFVYLTVSNGSGCNSTITKTVNVNTIPCAANANFSVVPTGTAQYWIATPSSPWNVVSASWSWGDASSNTNTLYASHQYSTAGMYNICLTVTAACGATASACTPYSIFKPSGPALIINVNVQMPDLKSVDNTNLVGINTIKGDAISSELYPNPNSGLFNVRLNGLKSETATIAVYNLVGDLIYTKEMATEAGQLNTDISLNNATTGIYFVKVISGDKSITQKLVIQK